MELPSKDSPHLSLEVATPEELRAQQEVNSSEWKGALSLEAYLRREDFLLQQNLTKDGGLTPWMLVYNPQDGSQRYVLAGCESIKKKALVARDGKVEDCIAHGVASVFSQPKHRGRGYAGRMMSEVGKKLREWQREGGQDVAFSILYSDIGKSFYKARGWEPFPSAHIALPGNASADAAGFPAVKELQTEHLPELCEFDEQLLRQRLARASKPGRKAVALVPDVATLQWHQAREEFVANELRGGGGGVLSGGQGAMVGDQEGSRVWCYWTRVWTNPGEVSPNTLHILRLVVEGNACADFEPATEEGVMRAKSSDVVKSVAALLAKAQQVAHASGMKQVQIWNPTSLTLAAAQLVKPDASVIHRATDSIASLQWYGDGSWQDVDWVCNEKYGWC